jgi:hypothetical protein
MSKVFVFAESVLESGDHGFSGGFGAPGQLIHSSTPNDYDYGLISFFKT